MICNYNNIAFIVFFVYNTNKGRRRRCGLRLSALPGKEILDEDRF